MRRRSPGRLCSTCALCPPGCLGADYTVPRTATARWRVLEAFRVMRVPFALDDPAVHALIAALGLGALFRRHRPFVALALGCPLALRLTGDRALGRVFGLGHGSLLGLSLGF